LLRTDFSLRVLQSTTVSKPYTEKQETIIPLVISQYIRGNRVVMATTISASKIMDMLVRNKVVSSTVFLVSDSDHNIIVADPSLSQPELIQQLTSIFENDADGSAQLRLHEQDSMVTMFKSEYGWRYYSVTPTAEYKKQASGILLVTTWLAFLLLVIGIVFSFIFSTKLYNPIRNLLDAQNKHERFSNEFLENAFSYLLSGNHLDKHDAFMSQIGFEAGQYVCCCIKFQFKEAFTAEIQDTDRLIILEKLKKVINGILQQHVTAYVIDIHNNVYVAMVNFKQIDDRAKLDEALHSIIQTFNYDIKYCRLTIGVGRTYSNISDLATSFGDAKMALAKSATDSDFQIVDSAAFPLEESFHFSFVDENKVINALRAGVISLLETEIRTIIDNNLLKGTSHRYMNLLLIELYNIGLQYLAEKGISPSRLLQENDHLVLIGKSPKLLDLHEHLALLLRFCKEIMEKTASPDDNRSGQLVARMIEYIDANYNNDLYLERVAAEMNLSAKYISKLFKETTGTNLADYISIKRISEAKKLLATTNMKNDEIALQIGILSRATFFRLFKKYEGVTPQDYRKMLLSEQKSDDLGL
jgi:AraC-like DNA-binding protein